MADGPIEIKVTLDKSAVQRDLQRMKEKVRQGQAPTSAGQLPGVQRPDSGRVSEVDRDLGSTSKKKDDDWTFLKDLASHGAGFAIRRELYREVKEGEFGAFAASTLKFGEGVAKTAGTVVTAAAVAAAMADSVATIAPIIVGVVNDWLKDEYPWISATIGDDAEEFTAKITGKVTEALAAARSFTQAIGETADLEAARARLGQGVGLDQIGSDFAKIQKIRANENALGRKRENEATERAVREVAKQLRRGAG